MKPVDPDSLDDLLARWQVAEVETPPDLRREVWRRIASTEDAPDWVERFAWWLLQPRRKAILLSTAVALGILWGLTHPPEADYSPYDAYVRSVSPFDPHHPSGRKP